MSNPPRPPSRDDRRGPRLVPIPKPRGGTRWLTRLDPAGDADYRRAVAPLAGRIERSLGPEVIALRARPARDGWRLAPWRRARARWRRAIRAAVGAARAGTGFAVADVRDCYGSITPEALSATLGPDAAAAMDELRRMRDAGVRGLPIGPEPSAILANAILAELDRAARGSGVKHVRWVDDLVLWGEPGDLRRSLDAIRSSAAGVGLELHDGKTRILPDAEELRALSLGGRDSSIIAAP